MLKRSGARAPSITHGYLVGPSELSPLDERRDWGVRNLPQNGPDGYTGGSRAGTKLRFLIELNIPGHH